ncbi:hypothetical protein WJX74_004264 [Apatococcus lobatus]|uniref:Uncharacterized protein n=1 Tax=Apatococcus lobatus TaxID=904363 RepID=A0AAW1Q6K3_9CHLO
MLSNRQCSLPSATGLQVFRSSRGARSGFRLPNHKRRLCVAQEGRFDEGATQVKRMLSRDRQQLSGLNQTTADQPFKSEFDEAPAGAPTTTATPDNGAQSPSSGENSQPSPKPRAFGQSKSAASPFGGNDASSTASSGLRKRTSSVPQSPFGSEGMGTKLPDGIEEATAGMITEQQEGTWWSRISWGQIVIASSFLLITLLMLGTTYVVYKLGGIRVG